jgi:hypothetical protein
MTSIESLYRLLLHLYPRDHRQAYGKQMLQHARDLERAARQRGNLSVTALYLRLIGDGLYNAAAEHIQALRMADPSFEPTPWTAVIMAAIPGLWIALTRRHAGILGPALSALSISYIVLLILLPPFMWRRERRFPVWALLPLGLLVWVLILRLSISLSSPAVPAFMVTAFLNGTVAAVIFSISLYDRRPSRSALVLIGILLLSGILLAIYLNQLTPWSGSRPYEVLAGAFYGPLEALMLVAAGLLFARRYNVLALLVIIGGYSAKFLDSDYLWGSPTRDWPYLPLYMAGMIVLFFVLAPVGLLRAKTRIGRAIALFLPAAIFLAARLAVPALVLGQAYTIRPGDALMSATILFSLMIGWILYSRFSHTAEDNQPASINQAHP